jgi:hypothetical protein
LNAITSARPASATAVMMRVSCSEIGADPSTTTTHTSARSMALVVRRLA